jgi:predicted DNA-binding transcriptional regulator YafY
MLALLSLLQVRRDWPGTLLSERLGVSPRTVRRDVDRLRELGYAVAAVKGPDGGYRLDAGAELPPLLFDDDQVVALTLALQTVPVYGADVAEAASRALGTLRQVMPSRVRHRIDALSVSTLPSRGPDTDLEALLTVGAAVAAAETLRFAYATPARGDASVTAGGEPRHVEPHAVVAAGSLWYLVAWDLDRRAWRLFRVDRVTPRPPTRVRFVRRAIPGGSPEAFVRRRFRGTASGEWACVGEATVSLPAAEIRPYLRDGAAEDLGGGRSRVRVEGWSWNAVAATIAGFGADYDELSPPELVDAVRVLAARGSRAATG